MQIHHNLLWFVRALPLEVFLAWMGQMPHLRVLKRCAALEQDARDAQERGEQRASVAINAMLTAGHDTNMRPYPGAAAEIALRVA